MSIDSLSIQQQKCGVVSQLSYIGFTVTDLVAWQNFLESIAGLQRVSNSSAGSAQYRLDERECRLCLTTGDHDAIEYAGWEVQDEASMLAVAEKARQAGASVVPGTAQEINDRKILGLVRFADPDGFMVEIFHGALNAHRPFVSPIGVRFVAGDMGLGHIVLRAQDSKKTLEFYQTVLGVRVSDFIIIARDGQPVVITFTHVNGRHHSLALAGGLTEEMQRSGARLLHFMLEVESIDDVGRAFDAVKSRGFRHGELGRHTNDKMFSFYVETPSGFRMEYGCGGVRIEDPDNWSVRHYTSTSEWGHGPTPSSGAGSK